MKNCPFCKTVKDNNCFHKNKARKDGLSVYCIKCAKKYYDSHKENHLMCKRKHYEENTEKMKLRSSKNYRKDLMKRMLYSAKRRAKLKNLPFSIDLTDIIIPTHCPVLGIPLSINNHASNFDSPSLDKIAPEKGYVKGNIIIVSMKANQIKTNASIEELKLVYDFYKDKMS